jgi:hypothetical protein
MIDITKINAQIQHKHDVNDIKNFVKKEYDFFYDKYRIDLFPISETEYNQIASLLINPEFNDSFRETICSVLRRRNIYTTPAKLDDNTDESNDSSEIKRIDSDCQSFTPYAVENCCIWFEPRYNRFAVVYSPNPKPTPNDYRITYWYASVIAKAYDRSDVVDFEDVVSFLTSVGSDVIRPGSAHYEFYIEQRKYFPPNFIGLIPNNFVEMAAVGIYV